MVCCRCRYRTVRIYRIGAFGIHCHDHTKTGIIAYDRALARFKAVGITEQRVGAVRIQSQRKVKR